MNDEQKQNINSLHYTFQSTVIEFLYMENFLKFEEGITFQFPDVIIAMLAVYLLILTEVEYLYLRELTETQKKKFTFYS